MEQTKQNALLETGKSYLHTLIENMVDRVPGFGIQEYGLNLIWASFLVVTDGYDVLASFVADGWSSSGMIYQCIHADNRFLKNLNELE